MKERRRKHYLQAQKEAKREANREQYRAYKKRVCEDKITFYDRKSAREGIKRVFHKYGTRMYFYRCPLCGQYHLSTKRDTLTEAIENGNI